MRIASNDPLAPERVLLLRASASPCPRPIVDLEVETERPCVGRSIALRARAVDAGSDAVISHDWFFAFSPGRPPPLSVEGESASFVPTSDGVHVVAVAATNDCGATSGAESVISVAPQCPF